MRRKLASTILVLLVIALTATVASAALFNVRPVTVNPAPAGEASLSTIFAAVGGGFEFLNPSTDQQAAAYYQTSLNPPNPSTFTLRFEYAGSAIGNAFGIFPLGNTSGAVELFPGGAQAPTAGPDTYSSLVTFLGNGTITYFTINNNTAAIINSGSVAFNSLAFGLYFDNPTSGRPRLYSEDELNPFNEAHMVAYTANGEWLFAWENQLFATADRDYNDMIVTAQSIRPVPEPGTMMLLGSGLVGLAGWGRKKFRK